MFAKDRPVWDSPAWCSIYRKERCAHEEKKKPLGPAFHTLESQLGKSKYCNTSLFSPPSGERWNAHKGDRAERGEGRQRRLSADLRHFATRLFTDIARPLQQVSTRGGLEGPGGLWMGTWKLLYRAPNVKPKL